MVGKMVVPSGSIDLGYSDKDVNTLLRQPGDPSAASSRHFSQNEEFFLRLERPVHVTSFPVHHDLKSSKPHRLLRSCVTHLIEQLMASVPGMLQGLTHLFDPSANYRPAFFRLYEVGSVHYIYIARIDLSFRPTRGTQIARPSNQLTAEYETRDVFVESDVFPLAQLDTRANRITNMKIEQVIHDTWIGETGRGYMRAGMWLDRDLTKFFSRLLTPGGLQTYPYFPFACKYRSISHATMATSEEERRRAVQIAHRGRTFLLPHVAEIEESLRNVPSNEFREDLPEFRRIRSLAGSQLDAAWKGFAIRTYLNENDEREFEVVHGLT